MMVSEILADPTSFYGHPVIVEGTVFRVGCAVLASSVEDGTIGCVQNLDLRLDAHWTQTVPWVRCFLVETGTKQNLESLGCGVLIKHPGLANALPFWTVGGRVSRAGRILVRGTLAPSVASPYPAMLTDLQELILRDNPLGGDLAIDLANTSGPNAPGLRGIREDSWLTEEEKQTSLRLKALASRLW